MKLQGHRSVLPNNFKLGIASTDWSIGVTDKRGHPAPGGAGWVRLQQLVKHFPFQVATGVLAHSDDCGFGVQDHNKQNHFDCNVIILQRVMYQEFLDLLIEEIDNPRRPLFINDVDDWYWGLDPANAAYKLTHPDHNKDQNTDIYRKVIELCDLVVVSTPFLRDEIQKWKSSLKVEVVENCVTLSDFNVRRFNPRSHTIGWVGSTAHRSKDLDELKGLFSAKYRFHHTGDHPGAPRFADEIGVHPGKVEILPLLTPWDYGRKGFCFDIGLAPLSDKPFNYAKSWIKAIEYSAAGVPFVASPRPEYMRLQKEFGIGRIAFDRDEWLGHITELMDPRVRREEAKLNRQLVKALDVKTMVHAWQKILNSAL
jgi:glycosyltransferase involved in cell wall biosynthesis